MLVEGPTPSSYIPAYPPPATSPNPPSHRPFPPIPTLGLRCSPPDVGAGGVADHSHAAGEGAAECPLNMAGCACEQGICVEGQCGNGSVLEC